MFSLTQDEQNVTENKYEEVALVFYNLKNKTKNR